MKLKEKLVMKDPRDKRKKVVVPEAIEDVINSSEFQKIKDICKEYYNGRGIEKIYKPEERTFKYLFTFDSKYGSVKKDFLADFYKRFGFNDLDSLATNKNGWGHSEYEGFLDIGDCNVRIDASTGFRIYSIDIIDDKTEIMEDIKEGFKTRRPDSWEVNDHSDGTFSISVYNDYTNKDFYYTTITREEALKLGYNEDNGDGGYGEFISKRDIEQKVGRKLEWEDATESLSEDIEKHDTLNPLLFDGEELKPEVKQTIEDIANTFVEELNEDDIRFTLKDIILLGSNASYNYTKDSDLDVHLIADSSGLECPDDLYTLLYGAYRSMFNKNYDIRIKGIPVEIYVEMDKPEAKSNGIYSLKDGWIKHPVQQDIPDIDMDAFNELFTYWEDKYFDLIKGQEVLTDGEEVLTEAPGDSRRYFVKPYNKYCSSKEEILDILVHSGEKDCTIYTLKNLSDAKDISHLGPRDVIYYYRDGKLYDKNNVKVMDYNLIIKNEENRKKFVDVNQIPDQIFDQVYADRLTEFLKEDAEMLTEEKSDDIYNFIEDLYDLRKNSIASEGEYGIGNLVFKEFRNLGYLDNLKELRKKEKGKELSLENLDEDIDLGFSPRLNLLLDLFDKADIEWEMEPLKNDAPYNYCFTILDGKEEKAADIIDQVYGDCCVWVRDQKGNKNHCKIIGD